MYVCNSENIIYYVDTQSLIFLETGSGYILCDQVFTLAFPLWPHDLYVTWTLIVQYVHTGQKGEAPHDEVIFFFINQWANHCKSDFLWTLLNFLNVLSNNFYFFVFHCVGYVPGVYLCLT